MDFNYNGVNYNIGGIISRIEYKGMIKEYQKRLSEGLIFEDSSMTVYTRTNPNIELSRGCQACKKGTWWCIFLGYNCNQACKFCSQEKSHEVICAWDHPRSVAKYWIDDVKFYLDQFGDKLQGVSYTGGEPLMYLEKLLELSEHILKTRPHIYQWVYTNGVYISQNNLKKLAQSGIKEIRVDLAATNFDESVVNKLSMAKETVGCVTVEIPSVYETFNKLISEGYIHRLIDSGVEQLNLAELDMRQDINWRTYAQGEQIYSYDTIYSTIFSPVYSRKLTLAVMEYVIDNKLNILINDCSNDAKHLQSVMRNEHCPVVTR